MPLLQFPNPIHSSSEGIIALGGDLAPENLKLAYQKGIFPWPIPGLPLAWFCPPQRAILELPIPHLPRSLARAQRKLPFTYTIDQAFDKVLLACSQVPRPGQEGTWITEEIKKAYSEFHHY